MPAIRGQWAVQQRVIVFATVVTSIGIWTLLLMGGDNSPITVTNYGFPLTFRRIYNAGPIRFFPHALMFDVMLATVAVVASGYSAHRWSAAWSTRGCTAYVLACAAFGALLCLGRWLPMPLGILILFVVVIVIPITWVFCIGYTSWTCGKQMLGAHRGGVLPLLVVIVMLGLGWWSAPHDIFYEPRPADIPALVRHLSDGDPRVRSLAISALRGLGPYDESTCAAIIQAMSDLDRHVRSNAISLAPRLGPSAAKAVPILLDQFLQHGGCTFELAQLGPTARDAVPALKGKLESAEGYSKLGICEALWKIEGNTDLVVPALIDLLKDDFGPIRRDAAELLGSIGADARDAVAMLQEMVAYVPKEEALPPTENTSSLPALRQMTDAEFYPQIRTAAKEALRRIRTSDQPPISGK